MSSTNFVDKVTVIPTAWLNDVNATVYTALAGAATAAAARTALSVAQAGNIKVGNSSYNLATATGTQAITGVGFQPNLIIVASAPTGSAPFSIGAAQGASQWNFYSLNDSTKGNSSSTLITYLPIAGTSQTATLNSFDSDGFTLGWTKTGSPTGTLFLYYIAFKL